MSLTSSLGFSFSLARKNTAVFGEQPEWSAEIEFVKSLASGVTAGKADIGYLAERAIATGANDDVDLAGVLSDALGTTLTAARLVALLIFNRPRLATDAANTTDLTIGGGSNPFLGFLQGTAPKIGPLKPGGFLLLAAPTDSQGIGAVTAATADILRITNSAGATNNYVLGLLGQSS